MTEQPHPDRVRLLPWAPPDWLADLVVMSVAAAGVLNRERTRIDIGEPAEIAAVVLGLAALLLRRRFPAPVFGATLVATIAVVAITERPTTLFPVLLVTLYTVASRHEWRVAVAAGIGTTIVLATLVVGLIEQTEVGASALAGIAWPAFATAIGVAVRLSRENLAAAEVRAQRAEQTRELEAQRRVVEERLRIARDVHDLVAHHLAVVNVQSGVAAHVLRSNPEAAEQALEAARGSASTAVDELGQLLGVLREPEHAELDPTPDLGAIDDLVASFAASGLRVEDQVGGRPRALSRSAEVAAYRMIQEALTNAHKHGDGAAHLHRHFDDGGLTVSVRNRVSGLPAATTTGYGLVGMRERIESAGGTLEVDDGGDGDEFVVRAVLPAKEDA